MPRLNNTGRDERGTVAILGVVMGAVLTFGLYSAMQVFFSLGDREPLTNAADAMAFDNAIWHAQGMNLLVYMNVAMAAVLSVMVFLRLLELLLIGALVLASLFLPELVPMCTNGLTRVVNAERKAAPPIMRTMHAINMAERVVASVVPGLPGIINRVELVGRAVDPNAKADIGIGSIEDYYEKTGAIDSGMPLSTTMIPTAIDQFLRSYGFPPRMGQLDGAIHGKPVPGVKKLGKLGSKIDSKKLKMLIGNPSLPVEEEDYYQVCGRAAEFLSGGFLGLIARTGMMDESTARKVASVSGELVGSLPALACKPIDASSIEGELKAQITKDCSNQKSEAEKKGKKWKGSDQDKCERTHRDKAKESWKQPSKSSVSPDMIKTAKLWNLIEKSSNNVFLHTWSVAVKAKPKAPGEAAYSGFTMWIRGADAVDDDNYTIGEAKYFFDCKGSVSKRSCEDDALWRPWWSAMPIRVRPVWEELMDMGILLGWGNNALGEKLSGALQSTFGLLYKGKHRAGGPKHSAGDDDAGRIVKLLFDKSAGSNYVTRYVIPGYVQGEVKETGAALKPLVQDLLIH